MKNILLVDDDILLLKITCEIINMLGYSCMPFSNPKEALEIFHDLPDQFDLVMTDYEMPEMNGVEFSQEIRKIEPEFPIIVYSGCCKTFIKEHLDVSSLKWFIQKPMEIKDFCQTIESALTPVKI
ncbi:MAG: response regulator [Pseudomonadota bacterium]